MLVLRCGFIFSCLLLGFQVTKFLQHSYTIQREVISDSQAGHRFGFVGCRAQSFGFQIYGLGFCLKLRALGFTDRV